MSVVQKPDWTFKIYLQKNCNYLCGPPKKPLSHFTLKKLIKLMNYVVNGVRLLTKF
jgi:hypothetical protein